MEGPSRAYGTIEFPRKRLHVPPEISYIILEHLGMPMEKETIKALCLTARDFWDPCQRALFTTVDIATTWSSAHFWQSPVSRLFAALTMNPILASTTRHLICRCKWDGNRDCPEDVREHIIFQLLPLFRNLQSISLDFPGTVPSIPDIIHTRKVFQKVFVDLLMPIVQQPGLVRVDFKSVPVGVLWYFSPSVKHMALERLLPSRGYPYESISNGQTKLQVESLYLDSGHCLSCLVRLPAHNFTHLRKLSIDMCDCRHDCNSHRRIVEFLKHFSSFSKLEVLNLVPCAHAYMPVSPSRYAFNRLPINITDLKFLRVFYLTFEENAWWDIGYDGQERLVEPMNFLRPFFMDISPTNVIERVVISCIYDKYRGMCQPTWDTFLELKNILAKDRFRSLHEVVFYARGMESRDIDEYLTPCVEGLRKQGINARMQFGSDDEWKRIIEKS